MLEAAGDLLEAFDNLLSGVLVPGLFLQYPQNREGDESAEKMSVNVVFK